MSKHYFSHEAVDDWIVHFEGQDVCISPVNTVQEALADEYQSGYSVLSPSRIGKPF